MFPEHLFVVRASVEPEHEAAFNRWYDEQHAPEALELPGCLGAARYRVLEGDGSHQYMATYAFVSEQALQEALASPYFRELVRRYDDAVGAFSTRTRARYARVLEVRKPDR